VVKPTRPLARREAKRIGIETPILSLFTMGRGGDCACVATVRSRVSYMY